MTNAEKSPEQDKRRSSLFSMARKSFVRSNGERGASAEVLRGNSGSDFEGHAKISRGGGASGGCCSFGSKDNEKFILLKGPYCFVYKTEDSSSPLYAINLVKMRAESKGGIAALQTPLGDTDYELRFEKSEVALRFCQTVQYVASSGQEAEVRKRLGHDHLLNQHPSMKFAESIAQQKFDDAPSAPITSDEVMANIPITPM